SSCSPGIRPISGLRAAGSVGDGPRSEVANTRVAGERLSFQIYDHLVTNRRRPLIDQRVARGARAAPLERRAMAVGSDRVGRRHVLPGRDSTLAVLRRRRRTAVDLGHYPRRRERFSCGARSVVGLVPVAHLPGGAVGNDLRPELLATVGAPRKWPEAAYFL